MANAGNAYATVNPIKTNIGDVVQGIEQMDFAYREEQRKIDEIKQKEKEAKQKKLDDFIASIPNAKPTGVKTVDEYIMGGMITFPEDVLSNYKEIQALEQKENRSPAEQERYMKAKIKAENLKKYPENLQNFVSGYLESMKEYDKGLSEGLYLPDPKIEKIRADGLKSIVPGRDENGMPTAGFFDENGDGIIDALNFDDINKKLVINPTPKKDAYSVISEFAKTLKADTNEETQGYYTIENKLVSEDELRSTIRGTIDRNALATEAFRRGLPIDYQWKPEEIKVFEDELFNSAKSFIEEKTKKTKNFQDENSDLDRKQREKQFNEKQKLEAEKEVGRNKRASANLKAKYGSGYESNPNIEENVINSGTVYESGGTGNIANDVPKGSKSYNMSGLEIKANDKFTERVENIYLSPDGKKMWFTIATITKNDAGVEEKKTISTGRPDVQGKFIQKIKKGVDKKGNPIFYKSTSEFMQDLKNKAPEVETEDEYDWSNQ